MNNRQLAKNIFNGIIGGAAIGFFVGGAIALLTNHYVIDQSDFRYPLPYEQAQERYYYTLIFGFVLICSAIGPYVMSPSFSKWVDYAIYGVLINLLFFFISIIIASLIYRFHPIYMYSLHHYTFTAGTFCISFAIIMGPIIGIFIGRKKRNISTPLISAPQLKFIFKRVVGSVIVGLLVGIFFAFMSKDYVIPRFGLRKNQIDYSIKFILSIIIVFTILGPYIASGSYGKWLHPAIYGLLGSNVVVITLILILAKFLDEQPFNTSSSGKTTCIDFARFIAIPILFFIGPPIGILINNCWQAKKTCKSDQ